MNITFNGEPRHVGEGTTLQTLVGSSRGIAIALNGAVVTATSWPSTRLTDNDTVEVVTAHQGG